MDEHQKTILDIEADASRVVQVGEAMEKALAPGPVERFTDRMRGLDAVFESVLKKQIDLSLHLERVDRGTDAYRRLKDELREVAQVAQSAGDALGGVGGGAGAGGGARAGGGPADAWQGRRETSTERADRMQGERNLAQEERNRDRDQAQAAREIAQQNKQTAIMAATAIGSGAAGQSALGMLGGRMQQMGAAAAAGLPYAIGIPIGASMILGGQALMRAGQATGAAEGYFQAQAGAYPYTGPGTGRMSFLGTAYGMNRTATIGAAGSFFHSVGGYGDPGTFSAALAAQQYGVDLSTSAGLARLARPGRGGAAGEDPASTLAQTVLGTAWQGIAGSEKSEYLAHLVNTIQGIGAGGGVVSTAGVKGLASRLSAMQTAGGDQIFRGLRGMQVATGMTQAAYRVGTGGPQDAQDIALMQEAGWKGGGGADYFAALAEIQKRPEKYMPGALWKMYGDIPDPTVRAGMLQRGSGKWNVSLGITEAEGWAEGGTIDEDLAQRFSGAGATVGGLIAGGKARAGTGGGGFTQQRAALGNREIGVGTKLLPLQFSTERTQLNAAEGAAILAAKLAGLAEEVESLSKTFAPAAGAAVKALKKATEAVEGLGVAAAKVVVYATTGQTPTPFNKRRQKR